jgi:four helix bundle protein
MQQFKVLEVWKRAHALVLEVYKETSAFPEHELLGMTFQLRRATTSISMLIAAGCGRDSDEEFALDLRTAKASANELEYLMIVARDLEYWRPGVYDKLSDDLVTIKKLLVGYLRRF